MGSGASKVTNEELAKIHVVIIGGGYAGVQAAVDLKKASVKFTIIEPKEYLHNCFAALRAAVNPEFAPKTAIPLKDAFGDNFIQGNVESLDIEGKKIVLDGGREIEFTHCIIAVGSVGPVPARSEKSSISEMLDEYNEVGEAIANAENIVIVGGGAVGVEFAGEITDKYKAKNITIVSSSEKLVCPDFNDKFYSNLDYYIQAADVKVIHGRVSNLLELVPNKLMKQTVMVGDQELEADLVFPCIGLPPNKTSISKLISPEILDPNNRIKVNAFLALEAHPTVFAIGDCCNTDEYKIGIYALKHAELVVSNILKEVLGGSPTPWKVPFVGMLIPFGASVGSGSMNGWQVPNCVAAMLKYGDLGTAKIWGIVGLKPPK